MADITGAADYASDFDFASDSASLPDSRSGRGTDAPLFAKPAPLNRAPRGAKTELGQQQEREEWRRCRQHLLSLNAYDRHKLMVNDYLRLYGGSMKDFARDASGDRRDADVVRENHRFLWEEGEASSWGERVAKKYWDKLFKEYCIADLSRYKENRIGMRWRTEAEVVTGKGQFSCGARSCTTREGLRSWEVNFAYEEAGRRKNALVKLRLCPPCSARLNYRQRRREAKAPPKRKAEERERSGKRRKKKEEEEEEEEEKEKEKKTEEASCSQNIWSRPVEFKEENVEEEIDDYLNDMFL